MIVGVNGADSIDQDVVLKLNITKRKKTEEQQTYNAEDKPENFAAVIDGNNFQQQCGTES